MTKSTNLTLPIQIGKKYVRRDGKVITASKAEIGYNSFVVYVGTGSDPDAGFNVHAWTDNGRISCNTKSPYDLVADFVESAGHPHAELMLEYAKDAATMVEPWKNWENKSKFNDTWFGCQFHPEWKAESKYRRKPKTVKINGIDVPKGLTEAPGYDTLVFMSTVTRAEGFFKGRWEDVPHYRAYLKSGIVHLTEENAVAMSKAMLNFQ